MTNVSENSRYIYCKFTWGTRGLGHHMGFLQIHLIRYAAGMQRIAVIPDQFPLDKRHNRGCDIDCDPYLYYDFDHMTYYSKADKAMVPLPCIRASDLDMSQFSEKDIKTFDSRDGPAHITKEDENYRLIIIEHRTWNWLHTCDYYSPRISFSYSERVRSTAVQIINKMMKSQESCDQQLSGNIEDSNLRLDYCCVHARRTDRLSTNWSVTMPMNIKCNLDANQDIDSNTPIYLMTDEPDDHFYDKLKKYYPNLFRYSDFPELYRLRYPADGANPNNYLLFAIEAQIQKMAKIAYKSKLYRLKNGRIPWRMPWQWWLWSKEKVNERCLLEQHDDLLKQVPIRLVEFYPLRNELREFKFALISLIKTLYSLIKTPFTLIKRIQKSIYFRLAKLKNKVKN